MIVLSVCHTKLAYGATTAHGLSEYEVGKKASRAAFELLHLAKIPCVLVEAGYFTREGAMAPKQRLIRDATLAVEIHCNANIDRSANYSEAIYHPASAPGKAAAEAIQAAVAAGMLAGNHGKWAVHKPRPDPGLFFLKTKTPAVIVEGVFVSNVEQATFLESDGGPEAYGLIVAEGIKSWFQRLR